MLAMNNTRSQSCAACGRSNASATAAASASTVANIASRRTLTAAQLTVAADRTTIVTVTEQEGTHDPDQH
jgi:hypothetical protein